MRNHVIGDVAKVISNLEEIELLLKKGTVSLILCGDTDSYVLNSASYIGMAISAILSTLMKSTHPDSRDILTKEINRMVRENPEIISSTRLTTSEDSVCH